MGSKFDLAVVLGTRFGDNWQLRHDVINRLEKAHELHTRGDIKKIIMSGKWSVWYDWLGIIPPTTEAQLMKTYLLGKGIPAKDIIKEEHSKDTIGNIYYLKQYLVKKRTYKNVLIICARQRIRRIKLLVDKIIGPDYRLSYCLVDAPDHKQSSLGSEYTMYQDKNQELFLKDVNSGNSGALRNKLYKAHYYTDQAAAIRSGKKKNKLN